MNSEKIQQLKDEMMLEMHESLNNSKIGKILQNFGISGDNVLKFQLTIDLSKLQSSDVISNQQTKEFLQSIPDQKIVLDGCPWSDTCCLGGCFCC